MTVLEKKKRAAAIAVSHFIKLEELFKNNDSEHSWGKMGLSRIMHDKEVLYRKGKLVGPKNL